MCANDCWSVSCFSLCFFLLHASGWRNIADQSLYVNDLFVLHRVKFPCHLVAVTLFTSSVRYWEIHCGCFRVPGIFLSAPEGLCVCILILAEVTSCCCGHNAVSVEMWILFDVDQCQSSCMLCFRLRWLQSICVVVKCVYCSLWNRCFSSQACWMFCCSLWLSHQHVNVPSIQSFQWWLWCFIGLVGFQVAFLWVKAVFRQFGCWNALGLTLCDIVLSFLDCFEITDSYERSLSS